MRGRVLRFAIAVLIAALAVALTGLISACSRPGGNDSTSGSSPDSIRVGAVLSLSGTYAALGTAERDAILLEQSRINAAGGIGGRPLEVIFEDDGTDEAKAVAAAQKLILGDEVVAIIGASGTGPSMAIRELVEEYEVPNISLAGGNVITAEVSPWVFQTPWPNKLIVGQLFSHLQSEGVTRIALLSDAGGYGKDGRAVALELAPSSGIEIVVDTTFNPGDTDMTGQVQAVLRSDAEAIVIWNAGKEAPLLLKALRTAGVEQPIYGGSGQARAEFLEGAGQDAEGFTIVTGRSFYVPSWPEGSTERQVNEDFAARFFEEYGKSPDIFAGHGFDAVILLADALMRANAAGDLTGQSIRDALEATSGVVGYGGVFNYSATDHNGLGAEDVTVLTVSGGQFVAPAE